MMTTEIIQALKMAIEIIENKDVTKVKQLSKQQRINNYAKLVKL